MNEPLVRDIPEGTAKALIGSILSLARMEAGRGKPPYKRFDAIYETAVRGGVSRGYFDQEMAEIEDIYITKDREILQSAKTQKIDVSKLIGEAEAVTA